MVTALNFLDMRDVLINEVSGSVLIFFILSLIAITFLSAKYRLESKAILMILMLWIILFAAATGEKALFAIVLLIIAWIFGTTIVKLLRG